MRVHKDVPPATEDYNVRNGGQQQEEMAGYENYMEANIKQEPLEPIVEIDESPRNFPSSIGKSFFLVAFINLIRFFFCDKIGSYIIIML